MENFKVLGHTWETIYNEDCMALEILINKPMYDQIKAAWDYEKSQIDIYQEEGKTPLNYGRYEALHRAAAKTYEIIKPIVPELTEAYKAHVQQLLTDPEELENFNNNYGEEEVTEGGAEYITESMEYGIDPAYDHPGIRFEDYSFEASWSYINIMGVLE